MNIFKKLALVCACGLLLAGCGNALLDNEPQQEEKNDTVLLLISPYSYMESRTALPEINFSDFTYELRSLDINDAGATEKQVGSNSRMTREQLNSGIAIKIGNYKFTLNAYKDGTKILSGSTIVDLGTTGNTNLTFKMYPSSGSTGSATITVKYPQESPVTLVKAAVSSDLFVDPVEVGAEKQTITTVAGDKNVSFTCPNLASNGAHYAHLWFYDQAGNIVYTLLESIVIVGGHNSTSTKNLTDDDWKTYACAVNLKKDNVAWASSKKAITLEDKSSHNQYALRDSGNGVYIANVAEGNYWILVGGENTNLEFDSTTKQYDLNYYSVTSTASGARVVEVEGGMDSTDNSTLVLKGNNLTYQVKLLPGFEDNGLAITADGNAVANPALDTDFTIENITEPKTIAVTGIRAITYTITYDFGGKDAHWAQGYTAPESFTALDVTNLPTVADVNGDGALLDAWVSKEDNTTIIKTTEGIYSNISVKATWKEWPSVDTSNKELYAKGLSLFIKEESGETAVYVDLNGDGVINGNDRRIVSSNGDKDFTDYTLKAGTESGDPINSDFTFTMTGGQIKAIYGLDSKEEKHSNKSTLNISGNAKIGSTSIAIITKDDQGNSHTKVSEAYGVMLESITGEIVNIVGQMSGDYSIICITPYAYEEGVDRYIGYIGNSKWATYDKFACYTDNKNETGYYDKNILTMKNKLENSVQRTIIRIADPAGVALPKEDEIEGDVTLGFSLGDNRVTTECSVFSLAVENGVFYFDQRLRFTPTTTEGYEKLGLSPEECVEIEGTLTYLLQPTINTYIKDQSLVSFDSTYVYMHILSAGNQITPEIASDFLAQVKFRRVDSAKPVKVKVNLETVPSTDIAEANVKYFDGSFYTRIAAKEWRQSYNEAKSMVFNQLHGYLMNVTSEVENNYIYEAFGAGATAWMGASRLDNKMGGSGDIVWDAEVFDTTKLNYSTGWYWHAGPEAGKMFWKTTSFSSISSRVPIDENDLTKGYWYQKWDNSNTLGTGFGAEPNNSGTEPCVQYLTLKGKQGTWNDISNSKVGKGDYEAEYAFVEFTPYETEHGKEEAKYQSIKREASY